MYKVMPKSPEKAVNGNVKHTNMAGIYRINFSKSHQQPPKNFKREKFMKQENKSGSSLHILPVYVLASTLASVLANFLA